MVSGRVQGVGFRNYVEHIAEKLGVSGYVRNRRDGSVEVYAMGSGTQLKHLSSALERGPMLSQVTYVREESDQPDEKYRNNFVIEVTL